MYIIYIYDRNYNILTQLFSITEVSVNLVLSDVSEASFSFDFGLEEIKKEYLKKYNKVKICQMKGSEEKMMFEGFIRGIKGDLASIQVNCEGNERLLEKRKFRQDFLFDGYMIYEILSEIFGHINGINNTGIYIYFIGQDTIISKIEWKKGTSLLSAITDLSKKGFDFYLKGGFLYFGDFIGMDRTAGTNMVEYRYDIFEPDYRSIDSVAFSSDGLDIINSIYDTETGGIESDSGSIDEYGLLEETKKEGNTLEEIKDDSIQFDLMVSSNNFFEVEIGDLVSVYIKTGNNDILNYEGSARILEKKYKSGNLEEINFKLSTTRKKVKNIIDEIWEIKNKVNRLEL